MIVSVDGSGTGTSSTSGTTRTLITISLSSSSTRNDAASSMRKIQRIARRRGGLGSFESEFHDPTLARVETDIMSLSVNPA